MPPASTMRRAGRGLLDLLAGPHGIDRYVELVDPILASDRDLAEVVAITPETPDTVTLTLTPPRSWAKGTLPRPRHGQAVNVTVEVDGVRHRRSFSVASLTPTRWTITVRRNPTGTVSPFLVDRAEPGMLVEVGPPFGEMVLPADAGLRDGLLLVSGGSGITPVMAMVRELRRAGRLARHGSRLAASPGAGVAFLHYARTPEDLIFAVELAELADAFANLDVCIVHTGEDAPVNDRGLHGHFGQHHVDALAPDVSRATTFVCGPRPLADAVADWTDDPSRLTVEHFTPPVTGGRDVDGPNSPHGRHGPDGTVRLTASDVALESDGRSILEQAEDAGLTPEHGCRMGICHTCVRDLTAGSVRDVLTGEVATATDAAPVTTQICISVPHGDCDIDL